MQTIILYKVVWVDDYGDINERDFSTLEDARKLYNTVQDAHVYEYRILGQIKEVNINEQLKFIKFKFKQV